MRSGTNVIDLDFEIIDPDDTNATVGILAAWMANLIHRMPGLFQPLGWMARVQELAHQLPPIRCTVYPGMSRGLASRLAH